MTVRKSYKTSAFVSRPAYNVLPLHHLLPKGPNTYKLNWAQLNLCVVISSVFEMPLLKDQKAWTSVIAVARLFWLFLNRAIQWFMHMQSQMKRVMCAVDGHLLLQLSFSRVISICPIHLRVCPVSSHIPAVVSAANSARNLSAYT